MAGEISETQLWSARWLGLVRLARSLNIRIPLNIEETDTRRSALIKLVKWRLIEVDMEWWASKAKKK